MKQYGKSRRDHMREYLRQVIVLIGLFVGLGCFSAGSICVKAAGNQLVDSGSYKEIRWTFYENRTMVIEGKGYMHSYLDPEESKGNRPWEKYIDQIKILDIRSGVLNVGASCFNDSKSLEEVMIADTVKDIGCSAFRDCKALKKVKMPSKLNHMGDHAFEGCISLSEIKVPEIVSRDKLNGQTASRAFKDCTGLKTADVTYGSTIISDLMFAGCTSLREIKIPETVRTIGSGAFTDCNSLTYIYIPRNVTKIEACFSLCRRLKSIKVSTKNRKYKSINGVLFTKSGKTLISYPPSKPGKKYTLPKKVTVVRANAFRYLAHLQTLVISRDLKNRKKGDNTFQDSEIKKVVFQKGVKRTTKNMFYNCKDLKQVSLSSSIKVISGFTFWGCNHLKSLKLPENLRGFGRDAYDDTYLKGKRLIKTTVYVKNKRVKKIVRKTGYKGRIILISSRNKRKNK